MRLLPRFGRGTREPVVGRKPRRNPQVIGLVAAVVLGAGLYLAFTKAIPFHHGYQVHGIFSSSNQLVPGAPVRIAGVTIGKVGSIDRGPGTTADVTLDIKNDGRPIHTDATLKIRPRLFLEGGFYVQVQPGSPSAKEIDAGGTIPLPQTAVPVQFSQILTAFDHPTRDSLANLVKEVSIALKGGGADALGRSGNQLADALKDVAIVTTAARGSGRHDVSTIVSATSKITTAVASQNAALGELITNLDGTTRALASHGNALADSISELSATMREAPAALTALDRSLPPLRRFTSALRPSLRAAPPIVRNAVTSLQQVDALVQPAQLPLLISRLKPTVVLAPSVISTLTAAFSPVKAVSDCVRDHIVPVFDSKVDDGKLSTGRAVWQNFTDALVGLSSASQNFDGNGPAIRYGLSLGDQSISAGRLPGVGTLVGNSANPIEGSSPRWLGNGITPPFKPDEPCSAQTAPDLKARSAAAPTENSTRALSSRGVHHPSSLGQLRNLLGKIKVLGPVKAGKR